MIEENEGCGSARNCAITWTLATLVFQVVIYYSLIDAYRTLSWPAVWGTVLSSDISGGSGGQAYWPKIQYSYTVDDTEYSGDRYVAGASFLWSRDEAEALAAKYQIGDEVVVGYKPRSPDRAVLVRGLAQRRDLYIPLGFSAFLLSTVLALWGAVWLRAKGRGEWMPFD